MLISFRSAALQVPEGKVDVITNSDVVADLEQVEVLSFGDYASSSILETKGAAVIGESLLGLILISTTSLLKDIFHSLGIMICLN